ncbi:hypothetical protein HJA95_16190 [Rhizobium binae]|nr:hypothetical protein [Rhizobium binae]
MPEMNTFPQQSHVLHIAFDRVAIDRSQRGADNQCSNHRVSISQSALEQICLRRSPALLMMLDPYASRDITLIVSSINTGGLPLIKPPGCPCGLYNGMLRRHPELYEDIRRTLNLILIDPHSATVGAESALSLHCWM